MRPLILLTPIALVLLLGSVVHAVDIFLGTSKQSFEKIPLWIIPFSPGTRPSPDTATEGQESDPSILTESVLRKDLLRSQLFRIVDPVIPQDDPPIHLAQEPSQAMIAKARASGVLVMAWAKVYPANGKWIMEAYAYEARQGNPVIRVKITADTLRSLAHRFSDKLVYQLTGEQGIAQTKILYQSERNGYAGIYLTDYDGENERRVISHKGMLLPPRWSFDATHLDYTLYHQGQSSVYLLELATGVQKKVFSSARLSFSPVWQPSGDWVVFASTKDGNANIYRMRPNGEDLKQLTFHGAADISPTWSPTGQEIAFTSDRGGSPQIYIMDIEGSHIRRITYAGDYNTSASWSPQGNWIAYACQNSRGYMKLCTHAVSESKRIEITTEGAWDDESPSWAPNGREVVFTSNRFGKKQLFTIRPDGTGLIPLNQNGGDRTNPVWSPR